jgi:hypothetical protein
MAEADILWILFMGALLIGFLFVMSRKDGGR